MTLLLLLYFLLPKQRPILKNFISTSNGLLLILISINLFYWVYDFFIAWYGQNNYEQWSFYNVDFGLAYLATSLILECLLAIMLCNKKWRPTIWLSIIACIGSTGFFLAFVIVQLYLFFFRDYLPFSWSIVQVSLFQQWTDRLLSPILFALMTLALYYLQHRYRNYMQVKKATQRQAEKH